MPTYEYACTSCGHRFEAVQSFSDPALTACPVCGGALRKVFGNVGIVLKGTGFYKNDSRSSKRSTKEPASTAGSKDTASGDAKSPATPPPSSSSSSSSGDSSKSPGSSGTEKAAASSSS